VSGGVTASLHSLAGLVLFALLAWAIGENRGLAKPGAAALGLAVQLALAAILLFVPGAPVAFGWLADAVAALQAATRAGTTLVFGFLGGGPLPYAETGPGTSFTLAFQALPLVLLISALSALLFHWGILPRIVRGFSWLLARSLGLGGAVSVATAANVFVGMVEAPLLVRPYLARLTRSELFLVMVAGMATIAGTVLGLYAVILAPALPGAVGHLLVASVISAPAAVTVARLMVPETGPPTADAATASMAAPAAEGEGGAMGAIARGAMDGIMLLLHIVALLLVAVALVALVNQILALLPTPGGGALTLERIAGWVFRPLAWAMGMSWAEAGEVGVLLGKKTVLNEFVAYLDLAALPPEALTPRARLMTVYALCGFANLGSLGIMIGGMVAMAPARRDEIVALGARAVVGGTLATLMTGAVIGILTPA